jgi:transposase InsO family protein
MAQPNASSSQPCAWACGFVYNNSLERANMLKEWNHHYNWHRPHQGIAGKAPMSAKIRPE